MGIAAPDAGPGCEEDRRQVLLELTRAELEKGLDAGEFKVLAWTTAVALSLLKQKG